MQFWEAQRKARYRTAIYLTLFLLMTLGVAFLLEWGLRAYASETKQQPIPYVGIAFLAFTLVIAGGQYLVYKTAGGAAVAKSLGGMRVEATTSHPQARRLYRVVEEMSIAASMPMPEVYMLDVNQINAFAAGLTPDRAAIGVTRGAVEQLSRDELQGVVAHEFSHIANADSRLNLRLAAMIMGFFIVFYIGIRMAEVSLYSGGGRRGGAQSLAIVGLALLIAGSLTWFLGAILRSTVSRQREYLADASAVQYTRNPSGIAGALRKIAQETKRDMPRSGLAYAHLYFSHRSVWGRLFATHPPIEKRIAAVEGKNL